MPDIGSIISLSDIFNPVASGLVTAAILGGVAYLYNRVSGQALLDKATSHLKTSGDIRAIAYDSFEKNKKLESVIMEGNNGVYIFLKSGKEAFFDLNNKKEVFKWWKAQEHLDNPGKIYEMANTLCTEELPENTIAYTRYKAVSKRNKNWFHPNILTNAGKKLDEGMMAQIQGLVKAPDEYSSSGTCHIAVKMRGEDGQENIIVRPVMEKEEEILTSLLGESTYKDISDIPAHSLIESLIKLHREEIKICSKDTKDTTKPISPVPAYT